MAHVGINVTDELVWELQDEVERGNRMLAALCRLGGIDPEEAARLPDDPGMRQPQPQPGAPPGSTRIA